ncbi:AMP-binding protein [Endothiovibrio diazotrophicus]
MTILKTLLRRLLTLLYRVEIKGLEHFDDADERLLIVANHTSFLDALLLVAFLPGQLTFAVNTWVAKYPLFKPFLALTRIFPMDPTNPLALKGLVGYLKEGHPTVIFPEGRITVTGALMKIYDGPGLVADKADAQVVPVRIDGAQYTPFSRLRGRVRLRWFPKITLTVLAPRSIRPPASVQGRDRRRAAGHRLAELMTGMMFETANTERTLFQALVDARRVHGGERPVLEDIERKPMGYDRLITAAYALGRPLTRGTAPGERVGLLLPNATATVVAFLGLHAYRRVPAMLNFTVGSQGMASAARTATLRRVVTSRRFVAAAKLEPVVERLSESVELVYLEDLAARIGLKAKLGAWLKSKGAALRRPAGDPNAAAVVLFTSGSEGEPKGVVLSHRNLLSNRAQLGARVDFNAQDVVLNALPMFHSFGLTAGTLLPLLSGMKCFLYPSPLHYRIVPEIAYDVNATVLFGTNTFLAGYGRAAHPYDFYSVRYVFTGAEKLQEQTRTLWAEKFGIRLFEGYGATETAPVLAVNTPMEYRRGSVGRLLPGIDHALETVPGIEEGGRLHVRGANVMLGYLLAANPGELAPPASSQGAGWYDTGDIVTLDEEGYVRIQGRAKRFAKIGGEMVSLAAVEALASEVWEGALVAAVRLPDPGKGEQLVLLTDAEGADRPALLAAAKAHGVSELNVPKKVLGGTRIPLLGTGKIDLPGAQKLAESLLGKEMAA